MESPEPEPEVTTAAGFLPWHRDDPTTIFLHVTKAAGTTFRSVMKAEFSPGERLDLGKFEVDFPSAASILRPRVDSLRIVFGHVSYGLHRAFPRRCRYAIFLRQPAARLVSLYLFLLVLLDEKSVHAPAAKLTDGFRRFVKTGKLDGASSSFFSLEFDNGQTRRIAGSLDQPKRCDERTFEQALFNLESDDWLIGMTESFDETMVLLEQLWGWRHTHYTVKNVTEKYAHGDRLTGVAQELVPTYNRFDQDLYAYGREIFERQMSRVGAEWEGALAAFKARNEVFATLMEGTEAAPRPGDPMIEANIAIASRLRWERTKDRVPLSPKQKKLRARLQKGTSQPGEARAGLDALAKTKRKQPSARFEKQAEELEQARAALGRERATGASPAAAARSYESPLEKE